MIYNVFGGTLNLAVSIYLFSTDRVSLTTMSTKLSVLWT